MKKLLLIALLFTGCDNKKELVRKKIEVDSIERAELVIKKADSVLEQHNIVKRRNLEVLYQVIEKYSDTLK